MNYLSNTKHEGGLPPGLLLSSKLELDFNFFCCIGPVQKTMCRFSVWKQTVGVACNVEMYHSGTIRVHSGPLYVCVCLLES
jgi:hypothetical protein